MIVKIDWIRPERSGREMMRAGRYGTMSKVSRKVETRSFTPTYPFDGDQNSVTKIEDIILGFLESPEESSKALWSFLRTNPTFKAKGIKISQGSYAALEQALQNLATSGVEVYKSSNVFDAGWILKV